MAGHCVNLILQGKYMKNRLRILYLSSEVSPFAKTGGLADVANSLPKALFDLGHDVRVMMPKYGLIGDRKYTLREVIRLKEIPVRFGNKEVIISAKSAFVPDSKVQIYFIEYPPYFDRSELYVDEKTGKDYPDNAERFALFSYAVLETVKILHWEPQIIHCNDWQMGLMPWLIKNYIRNDPFFEKTRTMFTIHNLAYQGNFSLDILPSIGLPDYLREPQSDMEFYQQISFLKSGITSANVITTVSPTYAKEIQTSDELSAGMKGILQSRSSRLYGIQNGADYSVWDPEKDPLIAKTYTANSFNLKQANKVELLKVCKMPFDESIPVIGMISRLVEQKGIDLVINAIENIMKLNVQLVILGKGNSFYQKALHQIQSRYTGRVCVATRFDDELAHLIEAGSDMFLMPSRFEPCGLNQIYSLRYGTVPIVRRTGGLADTIVDFITDPNKGNGFVFDSYNGDDMVKAIKNAVEAFKDKKLWLKLAKRGMRQNFSWKVSAENYVKYYYKMESQNRRK